MKMMLPDNVTNIIQTLQKNGHEAYAVGGCVRDLYLGKTPADTCVLEDSENGVIAASKAGCGILCIPDLKMPAQDILMLADYVVIR